MNRVCPHCNVSSDFTEVWADRPSGSTVISKPGTRFLHLCGKCGGPVCGIFIAEMEPPLTWPAVVHRKKYPDVPDAIATAAREAHQALGADAPRASVAMARATIEATAKDKGITRGTIQSKIDQLAAGGHITEAMREAAHEIRLAGNEAAHGDIATEPISVKEAVEVVDLMDAILQRVYQEPAKVARVRASRVARQAGPEPAQAG